MRLNGVWNILEMFDTKANLKWQTQKSAWGEPSYISFFNVNEEQYSFEIYERTISLSSQKMSLHEIFFKRRNKIGDYAIKSEPSDNSIKVFSIVYNGVVDHIKKYNPEIISFSVKSGEYTPKEEHQRIRSYKNIGDFISRHGKYNLLSPLKINVPSRATLFLLMRNDVDINQEEKVIIMNKLKGEK